MANDFEEVVEFYEKFDQAIPTGVPSFAPEVFPVERVHLKMNLIAEEFIELVEAVYGKAAGKLLHDIWGRVQAADDGTRDLVETADALADMKYVINGMAIEAGIPLDLVSSEVHRSNLSKLGDDGKPILSDGVTPAAFDGEIKPKGKILKNPAYTPADVAGVLAASKSLR
jgi:predicted HAD superfamily Cof-like phosphohydrolase